MKQNHFLPVYLLILSVLSCSLPGSIPAEPTVNPLPPTPNLPFSPATAAATVSPLTAPFSGVWQGPDPDDGSAMILTLEQSGNTLSGMYTDSYSGNITPPGYEGTVTGSVISPTTAQVTMNLSRHDGKNIVLQANLALSNQDNTLTATITSAAAGLWVLERQ